MSDTSRKNINKILRILEDVKMVRKKCNLEWRTKKPNKLSKKIYFLPKESS